MADAKLPAACTLRNNQIPISLIAGTGSIAFLDTPQITDETTLRAGGWGPGIGDEGSGMWLAEEAMRASCRAEDGRGTMTALGPALLSACKVANVREMVVNWRPKASRSTIAALAEVVLRVASEGDEVAEKICEEGIELLLGLVKAVHAQAKSKSVDVSEVLPAGGIFKNTFFWTKFTAAFSEKIPNLQLLPPMGNPVDMAMQRAEEEWFRLNQ